MKRAVVIVHWPGRSIPSCDEHAEQLATAAEVMGFELAVQPVWPDMYLHCVVCRSERTRIAA
jgi:hypothetical protein